ncbi:NAD(P)-binding protein [Mycena indigotica]|uniref:NAD(P)-binding protein n=1 Tax=Mycena indigotica TaxID=2126181 RepID=A0A8H6S9E6_9AGAR|nr:NAD(P)-binding protein [Mycena indigotica]KAF7294758.1 NAD(P)-binding protein [Mycena indigotica]
MAAPSLLRLQQTFLSSPSFAVVGASKDTTKYGTRVLNWYKARDLPIQPIHPREAELEGYKTIASITELPDPTKTSISIITPPTCTLSLSPIALAYGLLSALWLQPGAADEAVTEWIKEKGMEDRVIFGGPCILVEGDGVRALL